ncbi:DUF3466 family protein [Ideonella azotifigens]|uniref:HAF repeat-containing protein n=2 Tax=Ideonella azotifigens TaxID=513160 RepID=A0ABN1JSZ6_9BURK|nr:DUF3466 family protein [Ideonella azotifigens]MCD2340969.1 DUF3466 family protein [Ideonella azotifigens]
MHLHAPFPLLKTAAVLAAITVLCALPAYAVTYVAKQLKLPHDIGHGCDAAGINDAGQLSGGCYTEDELFSVGFSTEANGKKGTDLGLLGGTDSYGWGINNNGVVVGEATLLGDLIYHAVLRRPGDSALTDLGTLGGDYAYAAGINDAGQIVGVSTVASGDSHVFISSLTDNRLIDIGGMGGSFTMPMAINGKGVIAGYGLSPADSMNVRAFYAKPPSYHFVALGTLGGGGSWARAISDKGLIVGYSKTAGSGYNRAFVYDMHSKVMRDLGTPGPYSSIAYDVNSHGQIVGQYTRDDRGTTAAFVCSGDCSDFVDLNTVASGLPEGAMLNYARVINKKGQIVAKGSDKKLYLLTPQ